MDSRAVMVPADLRHNLLVAGTVIAMSGLLLSGAIRFAFNVVGLRVYGPEFLGGVNPAWSGFVLAATLLSGPAGLILGRAAASHLGAGREKLAGGALRWMLLLVGVAGLPASIVATRFATVETRPLAWLVVASALQMTLKAAYYAFRRHRAYFAAELLAALAFFAIFVPACAAGSASTATASVLVYPTSFSLIGLWHFRDVLTARGDFGWRAALRGTGRLAIPSLVLTLHGLAAFHGVILLSGLLLDPVQVGYVSVIIAALAPLHLLPTALNTTLFPEIARRTGEEQNPSSGIELASASVLGLALVTVPAGLLLLLLPGTALDLLALPVTEGTRQAWLWMGLASLLAVISAPCGSYLNATSRIRTHALLSALFIGFGISVGWAAMRELGVTGAGTMRFAVVGLLALTRLAVVLRPARVPSGVRGAVMLGLCVLLGAFAMRALPAWPFAVDLTWIWILLLVPFVLASLGALRRHRGGTGDG